MEAESNKLKHIPLFRYNRKLKVLLDARKLGDGGIGVYIENLIHGLVSCPDVELSLIVQEQRSEAVPNADKCNVIPDSAPKYSLDELFLMPRRINFEAFDLFHSPHFTLPFGLKVPTVITVHDLIHITHPEKFYYPFIAKPLLRSSLKRATRVVTVSETSKNQILRFVPSVKQKISVIPNAVDPLFMDHTRKLYFPFERYGLTKKGYMLCVCSNDKPHKGLVDLLYAFERAYPYIEGLRLVIAGKGNTKAKKILRKVIHRRVRKDVLFLGTLPREQLQALYKESCFLIVPSYVEGFCLPVIEAKSQGAFVVARPVPAVQELVDDQDYICSDFSIHALSKGIREGYKRYRGFSLGYRFNREKYSVERTVKSLLDVYGLALAAGGSAR